MKKVLICVFCILCLLFSYSLNLYAYERPEHDEYLAKILFGKNNYKDYYKGDKHKSNNLEFEILASASYLCVDQFGGKGKDCLSLLIQNNVHGIPDSIEIIDYRAGATNHRFYTHRGWDYRYEKDLRAKGNPNPWSNVYNNRKNILMASVNKVLHFGITSNFIIGYSEKCESFAALVYYIHILTDLENAKSFTNNSQIMDFVRSDGESSVITELQKHLKYYLKINKANNPIKC